MASVQLKGNQIVKTCQSTTPFDGVSHKISRSRFGIVLCLLSMLIFAGQDGITKVLVRDIPIAQLVMVRYWVFVLFALVYATSQRAVKDSFRSKHPLLQIVRALIGVGEIALFAIGLRFLGLAEMHALYAIFPLMTLALAAAFLGEFVGFRRWISSAVGFMGTLIILRPGTGVFELSALIPLFSAFGFAIFNVLTRKISQEDTFITNMFYMAGFGAIAATLFGLPGWVTPTPLQGLLIGVVSLTGVGAQLLLIQALKYATAATLQPFNYSLLVFASLIGLVVFGELPDAWTIFGGFMVIVGGVCAIKAKA